MNYHVFDADFTHVGSVEASDRETALKKAKTKWPRAVGLMVEPMKKAVDPLYLSTIYQSRSGLTFMNRVNSTTEPAEKPRRQRSN